MIALLRGWLWWRRWRWRQRPGISISRLTETDKDSNITTFTYNGAGKPLSKQDSGGTIKYMYDMDKVVLERNAQDTTVAGYTHEGGSLYYDLISMKRTNSYYYLFDGLGRVTEVVEEMEGIAGCRRTTEYGAVSCCLGEQEMDD